MGENIPDFLKPYPVPPYPIQNENQQCCFGTEEEYMGFLISEYGAEKVLKVETERKKSKKFWENLSEKFHENIEKLRSGKQTD